MELPCIDNQIRNYCLLRRKFLYLHPVLLLFKAISFFSLLHRDPQRLVPGGSTWSNHGIFQIMMTIKLDRILDCQALRKQSSKVILLRKNKPIDFSWPATSLFTFLSIYNFYNLHLQVCQSFFHFFRMFFSNWSTKRNILSKLIAEINTMIANIVSY